MRRRRRGRGRGSSSRRERSRSRTSRSNRGNRSSRTRGNRRGRRQDRISSKGSEMSRLRCNRRMGRKGGEKRCPLRMCRSRSGSGHRRGRWKGRIDRDEMVYPLRMCRSRRGRWKCRIGRKSGEKWSPLRMPRSRSCNRKGRGISTEGVEKRGCRWLMHL